MEAVLLGVGRTIRHGIGQSLLLPLVLHLLLVVLFTDEIGDLDERLVVSKVQFGLIFHVLLGQYANQAPPLLKVTAAEAWIVVAVQRAAGGGRCRQGGTTIFFHECQFRADRLLALRTGVGETYLGIFLDRLAIQQFGCLLIAAILKEEDGTRRCPGS